MLARGSVFVSIISKSLPSTGKMVHKLYLQLVVVSSYFIILIRLLYLRPHENPTLQSLATFLPGF